MLTSQGGGGADDWLEKEKRVVVIHRLHQILEPFMLRRQVGGRPAMPQRHGRRRTPATCPPRPTPTPTPSPPARQVEDVESKLPPKVAMIVKVAMTPMQAAIYDWVKATGAEREVQR